MKYQDALDLKNAKKENPFWQNGVEYVWMVVPRNPVYLEEYAKYYDENKSILFEDETAKKFAKDNSFDIYGVRMRRQ